MTKVLIFSKSIVLVAPIRCQSLFISGEIRDFIPGNHYSIVTEEGWNICDSDSDF